MNKFVIGKCILQSISKVVGIGQLINLICLLASMNDPSTEELSKPVSGQTSRFRCIYDTFLFLFYRHWMIIYNDGNQVTQRNIENLALITQKLSKNGDKLIIDAPGMESLSLDTKPEFKQENVREVM